MSDVRRLQRHFSSCTDDEVHSLAALRDWDLWVSRALHRRLLFPLSLFVSRSTETTCLMDGFAQGPLLMCFMLAVVIGMSVSNTVNNPGRKSLMFAVVVRLANAHLSVSCSLLIFLRVLVLHSF